ncbi:hypothetical protein SAY86_023509 [Trapa natans]|uniref:Embryonic flower 1 n=1 Tax=Trapa natans TaxID=22666 RepID=A0AAN7LVV4_TRANT|nr:hypothetical protein SAY86_023509 [Trapa natans]
MEGGSLNKKVMEDLQNKLSLPGPSVIPGEAFIHIDSITIDLPSGNSKNGNTPKCEHFSIRKYVSDMRKKDKKLCWLFKSEGECDSTDLELKYPFPPIDVPKFRWWLCQNCLQGLCEKENRKLAHGECNSDNPSCTHVALTGSETGELVSEFNHILKLNNSAEKGKSEADPLAQATATKSHDLICSNQREERYNGDDGTPKVQKNVLEHNAHLVNTKPASSAAEVKEPHGKEQKLHEAGTVALHSSMLASNEVTVAGNSLKNLFLQRDAFHDHDQEMSRMIPSGTLSVVVDELGHGPNTASVVENGQPSDKLDYSSSDDTKECPGYGSQDRPAVIGRRKVRKLRLLTDLLDQNEGKHVNIGQEEATLIGTSDASEEFGAKKIFHGWKMKRKFHPKDNCKMDVSNKEAYEPVATRDAKGNQKASVGIVEGDAFAVMKPGNIMKNGWTSHAKDENPGSDSKKRKNKRKHQVEKFQYEAAVVPELETDGYSLMESVDTPKHTLSKHIINDNLRSVTKENKSKNKIIQDYPQEKLGESRCQAQVDFSSTSCSHNALTCKEMDSSCSHVFLTHRNSCMCNKKSKIPWGVGDHVAQIPQSNNGMLQEDSVSQIKYGLVHCSLSSTRFLLHEDGTVNKGTVLSSLGGKTVDHVLAPTIPWQHVGSEEDQVQKEIANTHPKPSVPSRRRQSVFFKDGVRYNLIGKEPNNGLPFPNQKKNYASPYGHKGNFLMPQKEISSSTSNGEITGSHERSTVMKNHNNKISKNDSAQGSCPDDIPMDIVELMAMIQYEKTLPDNVKDRSQLNIRESQSSQNLRIGGECKSGDLSLQNGCYRGDQFLPKYLNKLQHSKLKAVDINYAPQMKLNHEIMNQNQQNQNQNPFEGHGILLSQCHEKLDVSKMNKDIMSNNHKKSSGAVSTCSTCHIDETSMEPFHPWSSSTVPIAQLPAHRNVTLNSVLPSSDLKPPGLKVKRKFEDPNNGFVMENSSADNAFSLRQRKMKLLHPLGQSDFHSNDKMSALHLLSLMNAHSGQNVNRYSGVAKQSSLIPCWSSSKEIDFGAYRASETLRHPSSDYSTVNSLACGKNNQSSYTTLSHENIINGVMSQVPLKVREKGKQKCSDLVGLTGSTSQKHVTPMCIPVPNQQKNKFVGVSNSEVTPLNCCTASKSENEHLKSTTVSLWPVVYGLQMGVCTVNRNPAEFSIPEEGNVYTVRGNELSFGKRVQASGRSTTMLRDLNRPKRGRKRKTAAENHLQMENHHHHNHQIL